MTSNKEKVIQDIVDFLKEKGVYDFKESNNE